MQTFLPGFSSRRAAIAHGGDLRPGRRKIARPFDPKQALHLVLRSSKAQGKWSMLTPANCREVHDFTHRLADRWGVRVYRYANVGNHLHLLIKARSRAVFQRFLRELSGGIAMRVTGARKGAALSRDGDGTTRGFWDDLAFSRIVHWGRDYNGVALYLIKNLFEAAGIPMKLLLAQGYRLISIGPD